MTITFRSPIRIRLTARGRRQLATALLRLAGLLLIATAITGVLGLDLASITCFATAIPAGIQGFRLGRVRKTTVRWSRATGKTTTRRTFR